MYVVLSIYGLLHYASNGYTQMISCTLPCRPVGQTGSTRKPSDTEQTSNKPQCTAAAAPGGGKAFVERHMTVIHVWTCVQTAPSSASFFNCRQHLHRARTAGCLQTTAVVCSLRGDVMAEFEVRHATEEVENWKTDRTRHRFHGFDHRDVIARRLPASVFRLY